MTSSMKSSFVDPSGRFSLKKSVIIQTLVEATGSTKKLYSNIEPLCSPPSSPQGRQNNRNVVEYNSVGDVLNSIVSTTATSSSRSSVSRSSVAKGLLKSSNKKRQPKNLFQINNLFDSSAEFSLPVYDHTADDIEVLREALKSSFIFETLTENEVEQLIHAFEPCTFGPNEIIIKQGDIGDYFYVLMDGEVYFSVDNVTVGFANEAGSCFGELALLYSCPRAATVKSTRKHNRFYRVIQKTFRHILQSETTKSTNEKKRLLKGISFLDKISESNITKLANSMSPLYFKPNEVLVKKGEIGDKFYVIKEGTILCTDVSVGNKSFEDLELGPGDYFGERALVTSEPRVANIVTTTKGIVFTIDEKTFERILGGMSKMIIKAQDARVVAGVKFIHDKKLNEEQLQALANCIVEISYKAGEVIFTEGTTVSAKIYLVRSGEVLVNSSSSSSNSNSHTIKCGGFFGEDNSAMALKSSNGTTQSTTTATAITDTVCGVLPLNDCTDIILEPDDDTTVDNDDTATSEIIVDGTNILFEDLQKIEILGEGTFGQVWLVSDTKTKKDVAYALKIQSKCELVEHGQAEASVREKHIMSKLNHPFIVKLINSYQDTHFIYYLIEMVQGGELFSLLHEVNDAENDHGLPEESAKFYAYAIADAVVYMSMKKLVYRDLKPENVLIDSKGYPKLVDFGFAKFVVDKTFTICGTPGYISPESILQRGYDMSVDHWAIGIMIHELMTGTNPFFYDVDMNQMELFRSIISDEFEPTSDIAGTDVANIISNLLIKDPTKRLGSLATGPMGILNHVWFHEIDKKKMRKRQIVAPWVPQIENPFDLAFFNDWSTLTDKTELPQNPISKKHQEIFKDF